MTLRYYRDSFHARPILRGIPSLPSDTSRQSSPPARERGTGGLGSGSVKVMGWVLWITIGVYVSQGAAEWRRLIGCMYSGGELLQPELG